MPKRAENCDEADILITPEMIEAGEYHLYAYHPDHGVNAVETVSRIYRAMVQTVRTEHL